MQPAQYIWTVEFHNECYVGIGFQPFSLNYIDRTIDGVLSVANRNMNDLSTKGWVIASITQGKRVR